MPTRRAITLIALATLGCMPPDEVAPPASPTVVAPYLRVGLFSAISRPEFASSFGLAVRDPDEGVLWTVPMGESVSARLEGDRVTVTSAGRSVSRRQLELVPLDSTGTVLLNDKAFRGRIRVSPGLDGLRVINVIDLESYLVSVVGAEMGRRLPEELAALEAQAVAARTYTLRNLERNSAQGYDLAADVSSQMYGGVASEMPLAQLAVERTRGQILTLDGVPIDAFYSSTCGGHTESSGAVFSGGDRSYLPARPDVDSNGRAWCAISPAYQWRETWNGAEVAAVLRRTLAAERLPVARASDLREARVLDRTASGRIARLELIGSGGRTTVAGAAIRRVLSPPRGGLLRSNDFTLRIGRQGNRIERVEASGRGNGHGVGMCQWGAIGRARAGQDYLTILMSYYPGTQLDRAY